MTDHADPNDPQVREAVARALMDDSDADVRVNEAAAADALVNPKELFCNNWDMVKQVLQFLKPYLPKYLQGILVVIIKAGDALKNVICS
jgi:hypothetical protein